MSTALSLTLVDTRVKPGHDVEAGFQSVFVNERGFP
jgi:hypothetical protein